MPKSCKKNVITRDYIFFLPLLKNIENVPQNTYARTLPASRSTDRPTQQPSHCWDPGAQGRRTQLYSRWVSGRREWVRLPPQSVSPPPPHAVDAAIAAPHCGCPRASTLSPSGCEQRIWERPSCPPSERANRAQRRRAERVGGRCTPVQRPAPQRLQHGEASRLTRRRARRDPASRLTSKTHQLIKNRLGRQRRLRARGRVNTDPNY